MDKLQIKKYVNLVCINSYKASKFARTLSNNHRNMVLSTIISGLKDNKTQIFKKNALDIVSAKNNKMSDALVDRLLINNKRILSMVDGLRKIKSIPDTLFKTSNKIKQPSGITVEQMRVPLGVIGMIYESRPNVTIDSAGLSIKSGNCIILRGGSEAINSNLVLSKIIMDSLKKCNLPKDMVQLIKTTDRAAVSELLSQDQYIDVIIPRGGKSLIKKISNESKIPVIKHLDGNCHVYIDVDAEFKTAMDCTINSKTQRYGVCNAAESLIVHKKFPKSQTIKILNALSDQGVEIRGCKVTKSIFKKAVLANEADWYEEYLKPIISVKIVDNINEAINHIEKYGSKHTDSIITKNKLSQRKFLREVDSSSVMINTSTRFADGFEYGMGAEIGISTDKIHARGPVGLDGLTNLKFVVTSKGVIRN
ncbi:MAG: glutamate-5-semialdehyde dehydrogenase [Gammaproteobacteria bacterium]